MVNLTRTDIARLIIFFGAINAVIVIIQIFESLGLILSNLSFFINDFWDIYNEKSRKPGFMNSILNASMLDFFSLILATHYKPKLWQLYVPLFVLSAFFGSRFFLVFSTIVALVVLCENFKKMIYVYLVLVLIILGLWNSNIDLFQYHIEERIKPIFNIVFTMDLSAEYSVRELVTHYRAPLDVKEFLIGNGLPRYSELGGRDPAVTRWLLQAGFPSFILIIGISFVVCLKIYNFGGKYHKILAIGLFLSLFKGELLTAFGFYSVFVAYAFSKNSEAGIRPQALYLKTNI